MSSRHILEPDEDIAKPLIGNLSLFLHADDVLSSRESERAGRRGPETYVPFRKNVTGLGRQVDRPLSQREVFVLVWIGRRHPLQGPSDIASRRHVCRAISEEE